MHYQDPITYYSIITATILLRNTHMDVRQCKVNHQDFLQHLEEFDHEEVIPTETDLHMRYIA